MQIRRLVFDRNDEGRERATLLYQGFVAGGNTAHGQAPKGMVVIRDEARILEKFEKIGTVTPDGLSLELNDGDEPATVALSVTQYDMLKRYFESTPWATRMSRKIERISDWLAALPVEESDG